MLPQRDGVAGWRRISLCMSEITNILGTGDDVDVRCAMLDYFLATSRSDHPGKGIMAPLGSL